MPGFESIEELRARLAAERYLVDEGLATVVFLALRLPRPLQRRCLYHWIEHPDLEREVEIVRSRLPALPERLVRQVCAFTQDLRWLDLHRVPGVGETLDWVQSLAELGRDELDPATVDRTLGTLVKTRDDLQRVRAEGLDERVRRAVDGAA